MDPNQKEVEKTDGDQNIPNIVDVETVTESLGAVVLSVGTTGQQDIHIHVGVQKCKWTRRENTKNMKLETSKIVKPKFTKRQLVDVMITEGPIEGCATGDKKRKQLVNEIEGHTKQSEVVLKDQHRLSK
ncbi:unnamed protein product [Lathyrus sativus]|nr:unnamed protein product [Lathyrus sativus]